MGDTTIYDIKVQYHLNDRASSGLERIGNQANVAERAVMGLKGTLASLGVGLGVAELFRKGKEAFVGFNDELQQLRVASAAMLAENGIAKTFDAAIPKAKALVNEFQKFAVTSPLTTMEIARFSQGVNAAVGLAGGSLKDLAKLSEYGALYAKTHGMEESQVSMQLSEGLMGNVNRRNRTMMQLLGGLRITPESFKAMGAEGRLDTILKGVMSKSAMDAAKAYEHTFTGELSTLKDNLQITLGKVGEPLFKAITDQLRQWNKWIGENQALLERVGRTVSQKLISGFSMVKDVFSWIVDHREALISVAEAYAAIKLGSGIANMLSTTTGLLGNGVQGLAGVGAQIASGFNTAVAGISIGVLIGKGLTSWLEGHFQFFRDLAAENKAAGDRMSQRDRIAGLLPGMKAGGSTAELSMDDFLARQGALNRKEEAGEMSRIGALLSANEGIRSLADEVRASRSFTYGRGNTGQFDPTAFRLYQERLGIAPDTIESEMRAIQSVMKSANFFGIAQRIFGDQLAEKSEKFDKLDDTRRKATPSLPPVINVTLNVATDDADALAFNVQSIWDRASKSSQPRNAIMSGFGAR